MNFFRCVPYKVEEIIRISMMISVGAAVFGEVVPLLDRGAMSVIWVGMFYYIAKHHHFKCDKKTCATVVTSCGAGLFGFIGAGMMVVRLLNLIPMGFPGVTCLNAILNAYFTYAMGIAFHEILKTHDINGGIIGDLRFLTSGNRQRNGQNASDGEYGLLLVLTRSCMHCVHFGVVPLVTTIAGQHGRTIWDLSSVLMQIFSSPANSSAVKSVVTMVNVES